MRLTVTGSPSLEKVMTLPGSPGWGLDFSTVTLDARRYFRLGNGYTLAARATGGLSMGANPMRFFVGGETDWINRRYEGEIHGKIEDIYFSNFITPFRGGDYYQAQGTRYALTNLEFRYPLIRELILGWPLPLVIGDIQGALFTDIGTAWTNSDLKPVGKTADGETTLRDLMMGYGMGARVNLGIFLLRWDVAWRTYWNRTDSPRYYFSLGAEF
jgi:outer membrane protein assembly factor BamA